MKTNNANKKTIRLTESDLRSIIANSVRKSLLSELDWKTYASAQKKAEEMSKDTKNVGGFERKRKENQAKAFRDYAIKSCDKQFGVDKVRQNKSEYESKPENGGKEYPYTNGELRRLQRQNDDVVDFYDGNQEYKDGKWQRKANESKAFNKMTLKESFKNNQGYSHFAVNKMTNKIVNGWNYSEYDPSELRQFKKDYFDVDLIDYGFNPKNYRIVTGKYLLRQGIDPNDNNNWANE